MSRETIALIEFGNSHDEVLYPQYLFLKRQGYEVLLVVSEELKKRLFSYPENELLYFPRKARLRDYRLLHTELRKRGIEKVVLNTASGKKVRNFVWLNSRIDYFGVLHNLRRLENSNTQKLISLRLKHYFFLADYLKDKALKLNSRLQFASFKAAFLPKDLTVLDLEKKEQTWIVIPGQVEYKRRDYISLIESLQEKPPENLLFILLGKSKHVFGDGADLERRIKEAGLEMYFKLWDGFVSNAEFYGYLQKADLVLPLIHPNHASGKLYENQISGAWNMADSYQIPLLMEKMWSDFGEFQDSAFFYDAQNMSALWDQLPEIISRSYYHKEDWQITFQSRLYCEFLGLETEFNN